jgi:hydrogenase maturation factor
MKLPTGKLPEKYLENIIFNNRGYSRRDVLVGPGIGIDSAVVKTENNKYIVATTDPITAAPHLAGRLSIFITTNDILAFGVFPRWLLFTILLPRNANNNMLKKVVKEMSDTAKKLKVNIVGGHTEVTPYLDSMIIVGTAIGVADKFISPKNAKPGDVIIMTKYIGIEGTAIIAYEKEKELIKMGFDKDEIEEAKQMVNEISIYPESRVIIERYLEYVNAMHDPTEGGIITASYEMARASGVGIRLNVDEIPIRNITMRIASSLNIDPYYLLSSGTLLISTYKDIAEQIIKELKRKRINATIIGEILEDKNRYEIIQNNKVVKLKKQEKDEIWKIF